MTTNEEGVRFVAARSPSEYFSEEAIAGYWRIVAWPVLVTLMVIFFAVRVAPAFELWREWILKGVMAVVLALLAQRRFGRARTPLVIVGALAGVLVGLGSSVLHLVHDFAFYKLFTLLTYPSAAAVVSALLAWGTSWIAGKSATLPVVRLLPGRQAK